MEDPLTPTLSPREEEVANEVSFPTMMKGDGLALQLNRAKCGEEGIAPSPPPGEGWGEGGLSRVQALLKLQSWLSPAFPIGAYSYSHGLEWAVEAGSVRDRTTLIDWLDADLRFGTGRNDGIFFCEAWRRARKGDTAALMDVAELAAAFRGTSEFALEASQQGSACLSTIRKAWPHRQLDEFAKALRQAGIASSHAVSLGVACGAHDIDLELAAPLYLQSIAANLVTAAVRLIPLGQTDGQLALAALECAAVAASADVTNATLNDLGSAAFMADLASAAHETQYTRLFRS